MSNLLYALAFFYKVQEKTSTEMILRGGRQSWDRWKAQKCSSDYTSLYFKRIPDTGVFPDNKMRK
jgi:hypothetical protein